MLDPLSYLNKVEKQIKIIEKLEADLYVPTPITNFDYLYDWTRDVGKTRYNCMSGGRSAIKTSGGSEVVVGKAINPIYKNSKAICLREFANTIKKSNYSAVYNYIHHRQIEKHFKFVDSLAEMRCKTNNVDIIFGGCQNPENWKGTDNVNTLWIDEAEKVDMYTLDTICPSIRGDPYNQDRYNTSILFTYNPFNPIDDVLSFSNRFKEICTFYHRTIYDLPPEYQNKDMLLEAEIDRKTNKALWEWKWGGKSSPQAKTLLFQNIDVQEKNIGFNGSVAWLDPSFIGGDLTALTLFKPYENKVYVKGYAWQMGWLDCMPFIVDIIKNNKAYLKYEGNGLHGAIDDHLQLKFNMSADWKIVREKKIHRINRIIQYLGSFVFLQESETQFTSENMLYLKQLKEYTFKKTLKPKANDFDDPADSLGTGAYEFDIIR